MSEDEPPGKNRTNRTPNRKGTAPGTAPHLRPPYRPGDPKTIAMARKGGRTSSPRRRIAAKLRELKKHPERGPLTLLEIFSDVKLARKNIIEGLALLTAETARRYPNDLFMLHKLHDAKLKTAKYLYGEKLEVDMKAEVEHVCRPPYKVELLSGGTVDIPQESRVPDIVRIVKAKLAEKGRKKRGEPDEKE